MYTLDSATKALADLGMQAGLDTDEVHSRLRRGLRIGESGNRIVAFYLADMQARDLYKDTSHQNTLHFAAAALNLDRRRAGELLRVGQRLALLPLIDAAFCAGPLDWSKVLLLVRVAVPEHEQAWLDSALNKNVEDLAVQVAHSTPGGPPLEAKNGKGTPTVRYQIGARVGKATKSKLDLARQRLSDERQRPVTDAEVLDAAFEILLQFEQDGSVEGQRPVKGSLYRIVLTEDVDGHLCIDDELGPMRIEDDASGGVASACIRCDAQREIEDENARTGERKVKDEPTPPPLREKVLRRDHRRCRCCGSRERLHVHHIQYRSDGGPTRPWNLITQCANCHAMVHEGLLVLQGRRAKEIVFADRWGRPLKRKGAWVEPGELLTIAAPGPAPSESELSEAGHSSVAAPIRSLLDDVPDVVDGAWWKRHAPVIGFRKGTGLVLKRGVPLPEEAEPVATPEQPIAAQQPMTPEQPVAPEQAPSREVFRSIVGLQRVLNRLEITAKGRRARGLCFPHTLFVGPPGTGKTTLAQAVAAAYGSRLHRITGPLLQDAHVLVGLLAGLSDGDVLFLDEIHAVPPTVLESLYQAMAERRINLTLHAGSRSRCVCLQLPAFALLAATTEDGALSEALRSRFGLQVPLGFYADADLAAMAVGKATEEGFRISMAGASRLAGASQGTPREVARLVDLVLDEAACADSRDVDLETVEATLAREGYDERGLDAAAQCYLEVLHRHGMPISLEHLAGILGCSEVTLKERVEPHLLRLGLVAVTPRGRIALSSSEPHVMRA